MRTTVQYADPRPHASIGASQQSPVPGAGLQVLCGHVTVCDTGKPVGVCQ